MFNDQNLTRNLRKPRILPGINFEEKTQVKLLKKFIYQEEFEYFLKKELNNQTSSSFKLNNGSFDSGDAEFLFNFIRYIKPQNVIEIGCGASTMIINYALQLNRKNSNVTNTHICVEPYEQSWLESFSNIKLVRSKVESLDLKLFKNLSKNDLLFIDSSHMIRPQGDVLYEYLSIIPTLKKDVYVHVHDIFTPKDYLDEWVKNQVRFWNEQYLLEALLTGNDKLKVVAS